MPSNEKNEKNANKVRKELAGLMDIYTGAVHRVALAYAERRNRERDIHWLALQVAKEYGAMLFHSRLMWRKAKAMEPLESIRKSSADSFEEAEHYSGYQEILDWYMDGKPCEVPQMWGYGDFPETGGPGPGVNKSLWPEHYGYLDMAQRYAREARSSWVREVISSNREGAAVAFHAVMCKLPVTDEFAERVTRHERAVARDELHHGPELIQELAKTVPSLDDLEEAKRKITEMRVQELRQRNEQFLHPMTAAELGQLEQDFRHMRIEPIPVFSEGAIA
ncbi:MAG: hypothetical protein O7E51_15535 [Acidobacteria bacterium]|nr:hypothetical protein [Acidobacteriota bacterium]